MAALATTATSSSTLAKSGSTSTQKPSMPNIQRVTIRDGQTVAINDYVYISTPVAPGGGEPYLVARVMEFVLASSSRKGAQVLASSSGTLQVRANVYLRQRDISHRALHDPRLLMATMHSDVFALENIRGLCSVRHRDLIGDAPAVSAWKRNDDHFYYHQLFDRYLHRTYDVIPTARIRNAPEEVLAVLRQRYSFVVAENGLAVDLCGPLRACATCDKWAASAESVRCDTCKQFFHMSCLSPPLASKPAKGYSWTCAPCSKQREQTQNGKGDTTGASSSTSAQDTSVSRLPGNQGSLRIGPGTRGRGRGRGGWFGGGRRSTIQNGDQSASMSRESTPQPGMPSLERRTVDDEKGVRSFKCWPYRYFGEHTLAYDVLDPDDSIYPRATPRVGVKYQVVPVTWEEQEALGLGVHIKTAPTPPPEQTTSADEPPVKIKRPPGRPPKKKKEEPVPGTNTSSLPLRPTLGEDAAASSAEGTPEVQKAVESEPERGTDSSVEAIFQPGKLSSKVIDKYINICRQQLFAEHKNSIGLLNRSLKVLTQFNGDGARAIAEMTKSIPTEDLEVTHWSPKELKALDKTIRENNGAEMRSLKKAIPTKKPGEIVRQFYQWKANSLKEQFEAQRKAAAESKKDVSAMATEQSTRALSPSRSLWDDSEAAAEGVVSQRTCKMCTTTSSDVWYRGPFTWVNRSLCSSCGIYWRKYAAEVPSEIVTRKREAAAEDTAQRVSPPAKAARLSRLDSLKGLSSRANSPRTPGPPAVRRKPTQPCVMCKSKEPAGNLQQCQQCSLCVHQGCYGLVNGELSADAWLCDACTNERTLDAALVPRCILCPQPPMLPAAPPPEAFVQSGPRKPGRPPKNPPPQVPRDPVLAAAAAKYRDAVSAPLTELDAFKPTECNNWVHLNCALYFPEVVFSEPSRMKLVEGASSLPSWRHEAVCDICKKHSGACVKCAEPSCRRTFHVSCACRQNNFSMGIDVTPVKGSRRDAVPTATFRDQSGHMSAVIYCDAHKEGAEARDLIDMGSIDPDCDAIQATGSMRATQQAIEGASEATSKEAGPEGVSPPITAAQLFAVTHKGVRLAAQGPSLSVTDANTHPLLRRAKRFDAVLGGMLGVNGHQHSGRKGNASRGSARPNLEPVRAVTIESDEDDKSAVARHINGHANGVVTLSNGTPPRKHCIRCLTAFSPFWWDVPADVDEEAERDENIEMPEGQSNAETPSWLAAYRKRLATLPAPRPSESLCVRCRHAVRPSLTA